jgi:hypothetical protein
MDHAAGAGKQQHTTPNTSNTSNNSNNSNNSKWRRNFRWRNYKHNNSISINS